MGNALGKRVSYRCGGKQIAAASKAVKSVVL